MPIDPVLAPLVEMFRPMLAMDWTTADPKDLRAATEANIEAPYEVTLDAIEDRSIDVAGRTVALRLYRPVAGGGAPVIMVYHGGGWVLGSLEMNDFLCRLLAQRSGMTVVAVGYNRAPESPYPQPLDDCYEATQWVARHAAELGVDASRLIVSGDSAGGNLAAAVAITTRERGGAPILHQLLLYPVADMDFERSSYRENEGIILSEGMMRWFWRNYIGERPAEEVPLAAILQRNDLAGLPPATIVTAEYDALRDEGEAYALKLAQSGVPVELVRAAGMTHGFLGMAGICDAASLQLDRVCARLRQIAA